MATSPDESSQFELQPMLGYDSVNNEDNAVSGDKKLLSPSKSTTSGSSSSGTPIDPEEEEEELQDDERLWVKLFPWLLKWSWFRKRRYKSQNMNKRLQWDNRAQYILTLLGYAVGLGNLWRFSYLVAKHGGASFIIPYFIMLFIVGIPLFYMESILGQSLQRGPIKAWYKICPNLWGIGLAGVIVTTIVRVYYNVIIGWVILYFFHSFQHPLPWSQCNGYHVSTSYKDNIDFLNSSINGSGYSEILSCINDSTRYYWYNNALQSSSNINSFGGFNFKLLLCFLVSWVAVYLCIFRGIKSSGKVIYFTATFPYVVMVIIFFRAVTLEGAGTGLKFLFIPEDQSVFKEVFSKPQIWLEAATQIFFSLGLSLGTIVALSSYSKQSNNCLVDSLIVCFTNSFTSLFASIIVFSIIGFKANILGTHPRLISQGPGLAFIVITEAINLLPIPQLWSVLFFIMLFLLGLDSHFGGLEVIITVLFDNKSVRKYRREFVIGVICFVFFLSNIPFCLGNGLYLFQVADQFTVTIPLLVIGCCELITISYIYGVYRFFDILKYPVHPWLKHFWWFVWTFVSPTTMVSILLASLIQELIHPLSYTAFQESNYYDPISNSFQTIREEQQLHYPDWSQFIGSMIILSSTSCVPGIFVYRLIRYRRARKQTIAFWKLTEERAKWMSKQIHRCIRSDQTEDGMTTSLCENNNESPQQSDN